MHFHLLQSSPQIEIYNTIYLVSHSTSISYITLDIRAFAFIVEAGLFCINYLHNDNTLTTNSQVSIYSIIPFRHNHFGFGRYDL